MWNFIFKYVGWMVRGDSKLLFNLYCFIARRAYDEDERELARNHPLIKCCTCGDLCEPTIMDGVCDPCARQHGADIVANKSGD